MTNHDQLPSISYQDGDSERVIYTLPPTTRPDLDSVLFFTVPKSGTVMLTKLLGRLAPEVGLSLVYIVGELYQLGILPERAPASTAGIFLSKGYCYGFPDKPEAFEIPLLGRVKTILLVRDPRDMVVSLYYSALLSHPTPGQSPEAIKNKATALPARAEAESMTIDSFSMAYSAKYYRSILTKFRAMAALPHVKVFRYEDVIYAKRKWAADICAHYGWDVSAQSLDEAVAQIDVFPDAERPADHVRQVHPGNYKKKLKPETIRWIEDALSDQMAFFNYGRSQPA